MRVCERACVCVCVLYCPGATDSQHIPSFGWWAFPRNRSSHHVRMSLITFISIILITNSFYVRLVVCIVDVGDFM